MLSAARNTPQAAGDLREGAVAASAVIYAGALVMRNAAGFLVKATEATGLVGAGRAEETVDNSSGANGDKSLRFRPGVFRFANSSGADEITAADIGALCYAVDDETVAKTSNTNARSAAGTVEMIDANGVWVRLDSAMTLAATV